MAIYLLHGTALNAADVKTVQTFNRPTNEGGLGLTSIVTLYIYNLKSLDGGVESQKLAMPGTNMQFRLWDNGWIGSRFQNLILDDLEEVKDGTFCQTFFRAVSLRGRARLE